MDTNNKSKQLVKCDLCDKKFEPTKIDMVHY